MNRRSFVKGLVGTAIVAGFGFSDASAEEVAEQKSLLGNSFDLLPEGATTDIEIVSEVIDGYGDKVSLIVRNNSKEEVYLSDVVGMVRDKEGTPLTTPFVASVAPAFVKPGEYAIAIVALMDAIDDPSTAITEFEIVTEALEDTFNHWNSNITVIEAVPTDSGMIGQVKNTTGKNPDGSNWNVVAVCFDDEGNLVSGGMDFQHATQKFNEGGSQAFNTRFDAPTEKFLVAASATIT